MPYPVAAPYSDAIRGSVARSYSVNAWFGGAEVDGATDLEPVGGTVTDTTKPGVRRLLNLTLTRTAGLFDLLSPLGTQMRAYAHITYTNRDTVTIPMGVFVIDRLRRSDGSGTITVTAPDKWVLIKRAKFVGPRNSSPGASVTSQIADLIEEAIPGDTVIVTATSSASVGSLTWEDREQAILDMAQSIGAWVYFDRDGNPVIADIPTTGAEADWLVDASTTGDAGAVLLDLDLERSSADVANVIVVSSSSADGEKFPAQVAFDDNPLSPTYAGTDPFAAPETAGPFGISVRYIDTPTDTDAAGALTAAHAELARSIGLASQTSVEMVPNPAMDAYDVLDVRRLPERRDLSTATERHVADDLTHPLVVDEQGMRVDARKVLIG